jgi:hypothetical protein
MRALNAFLLVLLLFAASGCQEKREGETPSRFEGRFDPTDPGDDEEDPDDDEEQPDPDYLVSGDVLVASQASGQVLVFGADGLYKKVAYTVSVPTDRIVGLAWNATHSAAMVLVDGNDRIDAIAKTDGAVATVLQTAELAGNLRGLTQVASGDVLILETSIVERFRPDGSRLAFNWPKSLQSTPRSIAPLADGGFVLCSSGSKVVRTYNDDGSLRASASSGVTGTQDAYGCAQLSDGRIVTAWSGMQDTVQIRSADLMQNLAEYRDPIGLSSPSCLHILEDDSILVCDRLTNSLVELGPTGAYRRTWTDAGLGTPVAIVGVP